MELSIPDIETEYGIRPRSIIKSKYFYIITSGAALYRLYPFNQGSDTAETLFELNSAAAKTAKVCPMIKTVSGSVCSAADDKLYILTSTPKGREAAIEGEEFLKAVTSAAMFHRALRPFTPPEGESGLPYAKGVQTLKNIRATLNRKNKHSEIDKLVLKNYDTMYSFAENAAKTLKSCDIGCTYCYGSPKEENFILTRSGEMYLTNWTCIKVSHFLGDLAYMIKRYEKKSESRDISRQTIIERYNRHNPLSENESKALDNILAFPEKYISILKEYYGRRRPFTPLYVKEKLIREINAAAK